MLYLAVPKRTYETILTEKLGQLILRNWDIKLMIFDEVARRLIQWIP